MILFIYFVIVKNEMISIFNVVMSVQASRAFRDLSLIVSVIQVYFVVFFLFRGLGFNINKFEFEIN